MERKDFFISYTQSDRTWAEWIAWQLEEAGYSVVLQAWDFLAGNNFVVEMDNASQQANATIPVLSPDYQKSLFSKAEWVAAFAQDPTGEKRKLIPVRVREFELKGLLAQIVYIDLANKDEPQAIEILLSGVKEERGKPSIAPKFPANQQKTIPKPKRFPGLLPPIWNVPHNRNPNFTGRELLLNDLRTALSTSKTAAVTQAITGLGGIGKTQTAIEYAYRHMSEYDLVWWVKSKKPETLAADYAALAQELNLPEKDLTDQPAIIKAVRAWFGQNEKWLLIYDNAEDPQEISQTYLPQGGNGHVLITSRNPNWSAADQTVGINTLEENEAVEFLHYRTGENDQDAATVLAKELGNLPLALEQAAAYILATRISLSKYVELSKKHKVELLKEGEKPSDYPETVLTTWNISFQKVQETNLAASELLKAFAFLAPDDIPLLLFQGKQEELPENLQKLGENDLALNNALGTLLKYSLIERQDEVVNLHRLVQAVLKDEMDEEEKKTWSQTMIQFIQNQFPFVEDNPETWKRTASLLPHAIAVTIESTGLQVALDTTGLLLNKIGTYLQLVLGQYEKARTYFQHALDIAETEYGMEDSRVASCLSNLGLVLEELGDLAGAKAYFERGLSISEAIGGPEHPNVGILVNNLGALLQTEGDLEGAKVFLERALLIDQKTYGSEHPSVAVRLNNLGEVLRNLGNLVEAKAHFERALYIAEATYGREHPTVGIFVNNLGTLLQTEGDLEGAKVFLERALLIDKKTYGSEHPSVAGRLNNLGAVLQDLGDRAGARVQFEQSLLILTKALGIDHPKTKTARRNLEGLGS